MAATTLNLESNLQRELLAAARNGSREAFEDLVQPCVRLLYRRVRRLTQSHSEAEEALQETLLKAFSRLEQFSGTAGGTEADFRAWVARIAANAAIDLIRRRRTGRVLALDDVNENGLPLAELIAAPGDDPEEQYSRRELRRLCADAIGRLDPELRIVCLLRDVLHHPTQEVAGRLGISAVAVRLRLFRARRLLRERLRPLLDRPERARRAQARRVMPLSAASTLPSCACGD